MEHGLLAKSPRIEVVDALRGFAVMAIMLLHNIEHFNFYDFPTASSAFMEAMDKGIWETLFFLFSGKAYAIFSLLFGFSFFIQYNNQAKKGKDFRLRFLWRLFLLFIIGCFNGAFFPGDILVLYSIIGVVLVLVCRWSDRAILIAAIILMLQPLELGKFFYAMINPDYVPAAGVWRGQVQPLGRPVVQPVVGMGIRTFFPDCLFVPVGYADGTQTVVCQPVRTSGFLDADAGYRCGLLCPVVFHYGFPSGYDLQQGDADSDEHGGFLFPQFLFHVCVGRLFCLPVATSFDP